MTEQGQQGYVITEEWLKEIEDITYPLTSEERREMGEEIRSHPVQSERGQQKPEITLGMVYAYEAGLKDGQSERGKVLDKPKFNSTELLLLANDEWKRREERKHNHDPQAWQAGFINGFLTDWKWARDWIDKIQKDAELRKQGEQP